MAAEIVRIDQGCPEGAFVRCRETIRRGGVVVYPTDTFYALGVDPTNAAAVERLFQAKGRKSDQPILLLLRDRSEVGRWAAEAGPEAERLMQQFWPGPLTLVFRAREQVLPGLTAGTGTIGLRVPGSALTRLLLAFLDTALTGTSANRSGRPSPRTAEDAAAGLGHRVDLILDAGQLASERPSTVADVSGGRVRVLREGAIALPAAD